MAEEAKAEAAVEMSIGDQAGDISDGDMGANITGGAVGWECRSAVMVVEHDGADVGLEGGELPIADAGLAAGESPEEGGFAGVGEAHEPDVGEQFELQLQVERHARFASGGEFGSRARPGDEMRVAEPAGGPGDKEHRFLHRLREVDGDGCRRLRRGQV